MYEMQTFKFHKLQQISYGNGWESQPISKQEICKIQTDLPSIFYFIEEPMHRISYQQIFLLSVDTRRDKWYVLFFITQAERCQSEWSNIYIIIQLVLTI